MKTLYLTADRVGGPGGGASVTSHELNALRTLSDDISMITRDELAPLCSRLPQTPFCEDYAATWLVRDMVPDLVHVYGGCLSQTVRLLKAKGAMISYTAAAHDRKLSIEEFLRLGMVYPHQHISDELLWPIYLDGYSLANLVICPSTHSASLMTEYGCQNVKVIPHGCDIPAEYPPMPEQFTVGYLGQFGPDKGLQYLLRAWSMMPIRNKRLIIAGYGTEAAQTIVDEIKLQNVEILGYIQSVEEFYSRISLYVQPSVTEGFGLEVLEAMARGRPVIATTGVGAADVITERFNGYVVPIRNPFAIALAIMTLATPYDPISSLRAMQAQVREKARQYSWDKIEAKYVETWRKLLA